MRHLKYVLYGIPVVGAAVAVSMGLMHFLQQLWFQWVFGIALSLYLAWNISFRIAGD